MKDMSHWVKIDGVFHLISVVLDGVTGEVKIYDNGVLKNTWTPTK